MVSETSVPVHKDENNGKDQGAVPVYKLRHVLPGLVVVLLVGTVAYYISQLSNSLDALAVAILLGLATRIIL